MNYKDPTNEGLFNAGGVHCAFCKGEWGAEHLEKTPELDWICPNCRLKCDYCEQYFPTNEITRVEDGLACPECMDTHSLVSLQTVKTSAKIIAESALKTARMGLACDIATGNIERAKIWRERINIHEKELEIFDNSSNLLRL